MHSHTMFHVAVLLFANIYQHLFREAVLFRKLTSTAFHEAALLFKTSFETGVF